MKQHTLNKDSWHFRLANFGDRRVWADDEIDICYYIRKVFGGATAFLALVIFAIIFVVIFGYGYITGAIWLYECISTGVWVAPNPVAGLTLGATVVLGLALGWVIMLDHINRVRLNARHDGKITEPSFVSLAYSKFKSKTCFRINFK